MAKSELLTKILANRINTLKSNGTTDFTEITNTLDIFIAGAKITPEQYTELTQLMA